jgi:hypothetical protein
MEVTMSARRFARLCCIAGLLLAASDQARAETPSAPAQTPTKPATAAARDGQRDFDFEFGTWKVHLRRLVNPLSGESTWVDLHGTSTVKKVWGGRANLGEIDVRDSDKTRIVGMSLRLYDPDARQWRIHWANSRDGRIGPAMVGRFENGRGEFYNQEELRGAAIYVRFIFSDITPTTFRLEQAFSADGGKTWEPNWIARFTRQKPTRAAAR